MNSVKSIVNQTRFTGLPVKFAVAAVLALITLMAGGCSNSSSDDPVVTPSAATVVAATKVTSQSVDTGSLRIQPPTMAQQLANPNVPANVRAVIQAHLQQQGH